MMEPTSLYWIPNFNDSGSFFLVELMWHHYNGMDVYDKEFCCEIGFKFFKEIRVKK
jgi:hypothetical protein